MSKLALIKDGVVYNVIEARLDWPGEWVEIPEKSPVSIGYTYDGRKFTKPGRSTPATHREDFDSKDLLNEFTPTEAFKAQLAGGLVSAQYLLLVHRTKPIGKDHPGYAVALGDFLTAGVITQERHDDLLNGIPV